MYTHEFTRRRAADQGLENRAEAADRKCVGRDAPTSEIGRRSRRLPGHRNITTTWQYMHLDDKELADEQDLID